MNIKLLNEMSLKPVNFVSSDQSTDQGLSFVFQAPSA